MPSNAEPPRHPLIAVGSPGCPLCGHPAPTLLASAELCGQPRDYFRCPGCRLTFLDPAALPSKAEEKAQYDLHRNDPTDDGYRQFLSRLTGPLIVTLREHFPDGASGLDFGCGPGPTLSGMLREKGFSMQDHDPVYAPDPQVLAQHYDFITCTEVVEHFHAPGDAFALLDSLLRPGGILAIMTSWLMNDANFIHWHYRRDPTHVCFYKPATFQWLADRYGYALMLPDTNITLLRKHP